MNVNIRILRLSNSGLPMSWVSPEAAAVLYSMGRVEWSVGDSAVTLRGGTNKSGVRSSLTIAPIIAAGFGVKKNIYAPPLSNPLLFRRDDYRCMYCGFEFSDKELTRDHIIPRVQGGADIWTNVVAACRRCNCAKGGRTPEQAGMGLLAVPFEPNVFEFMYLANRKILGDQMEYLQSRFTSMRCWQAA